MPTRPLSWPVSSKESARRLGNALSSAQLSLLHPVADEATARGLPLYLVGGFVRDLLLRQPSLDLDLVVEGDAIALASALAKNHGGKITAHKRFGTAQWFLPDSLLGARHPALDFISARSETYPRPGALPVVKPGSLADDLRRRDFTINTLALRLDGSHFGELHDELGGRDDLEKGVVRVLHPNSYRDDPTRILRAVRYAGRYGFRITPKDLALIRAAKPQLGGLSGERLRHELDLILAEEKAAAMLSRLAGLELLAEIHPSLAWDDSLRPLFEKLDQPEPDSWHGAPNLARLPRRVALGYLLWLSDLDPALIESLAARLDFTASLREALLASASLHNDLACLANAKPSAITARLNEVPLLAVCALSLESTSLNESVKESVERYLSCWRHVKPKTTGHTLQKLGLSPGPAYSAILSRLKNAWLDGEIHTAEEEKNLLEQLRESTIRT